MDMINEQMTDLEIRRQVLAKKRKKRNRLRVLVFCLASALMVVCGLVAGWLAGVIMASVQKAEPVIDTSVPIVEIAAEQIGDQGGEKYWSWYGFGSHVSWCACFTSWCADQAGYLDSGAAPKFSSVGDGIYWFQDRDQWLDAGETPSAGDFIFFDWEQDDYRDHVGIVAGVKNGVIYTIEGNSSDMCRIKRYREGDPVINGYGHIDTSAQTEDQ